MRASERRQSMCVYILCCVALPIEKVGCVEKYYTETCWLKKCKAENVAQKRNEARQPIARFKIRPIKKLR